MKLNRTIYLPISAILILALQGCAHMETSKKLDEKLAEQQEVKSPKEIHAEARDCLEKATNLTKSQKAELLALEKTVHDQTQALRGEEMKLQEILVKDLMDPNYDPEEVDSIKKRIKANEDTRLNLIFDGVAKANKILNHVSAHKAVLLRGLMAIQN